MTAQPSVEWQRLWFTLQGHQWTSLVVIGIDGAKDASQVAMRIAEVGNLDKRTPVRVISAFGASLDAVAQVVDQLGEPTLTVVTCDSPRSNPAMLPLVQAASGVVLVVRLGETWLDSVRKTVDSIGRHKVLATVSVG
jgi:hypothetical protein